MKSGLTLTEILIAVAIMIVLASVSWPLLGNWPFKVQASSAKAQLAQMVRLARERSVAGLNDKSHGLWLDSASYTVFQGDNYAARQADYDFKTNLDNGLSLSWQLAGVGAANEIVFNRAGVPARYGKIIITSSAGDTAEIDINQLGIVN
jgi:Tfp pilus assembly protein FimT